MTAVFDVGGYPWTISLPERFEKAHGRAARRRGRPLLSTLDHWLNLPGERQFIDAIDPDAARDRRALPRRAGIGRGQGLVHAHTREERSTTCGRGAGAGEEARTRGLPLIVHATGLAEAKAALRAGAKLLVHSVWDLPVDEEFLDLAAQHGTIYCPTLDGGRRLRAALRGGARIKRPPSTIRTAASIPRRAPRLAETARSTPKPEDELTEELLANDRAAQR